MASLALFLEDGTSHAQVLDTENPLTLGRHPDNVLPLTCESVSSHHAVLSFHEDGWYVQDLQSSNGTRVNGAPIEEALLENGDRLSFGEVQAVFYVDDEAAATAVAADAAEPARPAAPVADGFQPVSYIPPQPLAPPIKRKLPAERMRQMNYPGEESSGCMQALFLTGLCLGSVLLGLILHHYQSTGRNFISDAFSSVFGKLPRITIEKKMDEGNK